MSDIAERWLWTSVLLRAARDALCEVLRAGEVKTFRYRGAYNWILGPSCKDVCDALGVNYGLFRRRVAQYRSEAESISPQWMHDESLKARREELLDVFVLDARLMR